MSEKRPADDDWLEEDKPEPPPWWKTRRALLLGIVIAGVLAFMFSRGRDTAQPQAPKTAAAISVVVPYAPAITEAKAEPETPPTTPKITLPAVVVPTPPSTIPGPAAPVSRPAMVSYAVPAAPKPPQPQPGDPEHPAKTGIKFATATIAGIKASPAIDDTYILYPGLLVIELDSAIDSNLPGPIQANR
jgi:hypothetical protein